MYLHNPDTRGVVADSANEDPADIDRDHDRRTHPDRLLRLTAHSTF